MKRFFEISFVGLFLIVLFSCGVVAAESVPPGGTIRILGIWGTIPHNFNPFLASGQNAAGTRSALYEQLFFVNVLNGDVTPVLGTSYEWLNDNLKLVIKVRKGVRWSDGAPFTAKDVAFTFNYMKKHPALDLSGIWANGLNAVKVVDDETIEFTFSQQNTPLFQYIASTLVVPEHVWSKIDDPTTFTNPEPVVTGPFLLKSYTSQAVTYTRNPNYWMEGRPYVDQVSYQAVKSNDTTLLLLLRKQADYSYLFIPDPEKAFVEKDPKNNHYWWPVTNTNILYLNTTKAPFNDVAFRRALAYAIDTKPLSEKAYYGVIAPANPTGIVPGQQPKWLDKSVKDIAYTYNVSKAKEILRNAGYTWDSSGSLMSPKGQRVPAVKILVGAGWTDFISMAQMISQNLKDIGVEVVIDQEPWNSYINSLMGGTYDTAICWGTGSGSTPYDLYYRTLASEFAGLDGGEAKSNYSRYTNPVVDQALATFRSSSDFEVQREALAKIQRVVVTEVPFIPLTCRTQFNAYQSALLEGWPTDEDPYTGGDAADELGGRWMLINLHLAK